MPDQSIIEIAISVVTAALGWVVKMIWSSQKEHRDKLNAVSGEVTRVELKMTGEYVRRDEFSRALTSLENKLDSGFQRVFDKLDGKADK